MYVLLAFFVASVNPAYRSNPHTGVAMQEFTTFEKCEAAKKEVVERTKRDATLGMSVLHSWCGAKNFGFSR